MGVTVEYRTVCEICGVSSGCRKKKMAKTDISDHDVWALYDTRYPVIYLNKYTITHSESFYEVYFP